MTTVYLDRKHLHLDITGNSLSITTGDGERSALPLGLITRVVVRGSGVTFDSGTLGALAARGVHLVLLTGKHHRQIANLFGQPHGNAQIRLAQCRAYHSQAFRLAFSADLIHRKLHRQQHNLLNHLTRRPDLRKPLTDANQHIARIEPQLDGLTTLAAIMGVEGSAAASYFSAFTLLFAPSLEFVQRRRRPPPDPVNACLSLGYTLLHTEAVRAAYSAGLDPYIGFLHAPYHGRESLAADLMEPLRPAVDNLVYQMFADTILRPDHFSTANGECQMGKTGRSRFYEAYEQFAALPRRYLRFTTRHLVNQLSSFDPEPTPIQSAEMYA